MPGSTAHLVGFAIALGAIVLGCSSPPLPAYAEHLSPSAVVLDLPSVQQDELYDCGLAAISAQCQYYDIALPAERRAELARSAAAHGGLSGAELREVLERVGFEVFIFAGTRDHTVTGLLGQVDRQRPALVLLAPDPESTHYCLFLGYDEPRGNVVLLDPRHGRILMSSASFDRAWSAAEHFTLLAIPVQTQTTAIVHTSNP